MRLLRLVVGVLLIAVSIILSAAALYGLTRTGSCGATGAAVAIRECPEGTGTQVLVLIASIFVMPFAGMAIAPTGRVFLGGVWWCLVWIAMGGAALVAGYGPAAPPGAEDGALGVGITFLAIGGLSLIGAVVTGVLATRGMSRAELRARSSGPPKKTKPKPKPSPSPAPAATDQFADRQMSTLAQQLGSVAKARSATQDDPLAARLRKLDELRTAGLITDAEHAARREEILDEV